MSASLIVLLCTAGSLAVLLVSYGLQKKMEQDRERRIRLAASLWLSALLGVLILAGYSFWLFQMDFDGLLYRDKEMVQYAVLVFPAAYYLVFLILSAICQNVVNRFFDHRSMQESLAMSFYQWQQRGKVERWVFNRSKVPYRTFTRIFSMVLLACVIVLMCAIACSGPVLMPLWYCVPVLLLVFCRTFALYLGGILADEKADAVEQDPLAAQQEHRYALAARHLKEQFGDALLYMKLPEEEPKEKSPFKTLHALEKSSNINDRLAAASFRSRFSPERLEPDYVQAASCLLGKQNVMIFNPFYQDLGMYLALPLGESLMSHRKILVLCEGNEGALDVCRWMDQVLDQNGSFHEKWKIRILEDLVPDCDVGILSYSRLYDPDVFAKNRDFFAQCEYVLLLEPSQVLATMQVPLGILSDLVSEGHVKPVFCVLDQNRNGLKDTISHVLKTSFDVDFVLADQASAQTLMIWDANADFQAIERFQKETLFLAGGIELGAEAVSVQIPQTDWIAKSAVPLLDIQNNAIQSYSAICERMNIEPGQQALRDHLKVQPSLWSLPRKEAEFLIVEDEFRNPFAAARNYSTRGRKEVFINVLSSSYMLRDYFCANPQIFLTNPNAIRSLVPDYVKSSRNLLLRLIMKMSAQPMSEEQLQKEFSLGDLKTDHPKELLLELLERYTFARPDLFEVDVQKIRTACSKPEIITNVSINPEKFEEYFGNTLKNASYILEDEAYDRHLLNSKPYSLIPQVLLPGQFMTFEGKNYRVKSITPAEGVILRRASDFTDGRKTYRQLRYYHLPDFNSLEPSEFEKIGAFDFARYETHFRVDTIGYTEISSRNGSLREEAHVFSSTHTPAQLNRTYTSKSVLCIRFPQLMQEHLYQFAELLQELLPTVMPDGYPYLAILARKPQGIEFDGTERVYGSDLQDEQVLAVVEDSDFDLGLLDTFQKYFPQFLEIIQDYLRWAQETLENQSSQPDLSDSQDGNAGYDPLDFDPDQVDLEQMDNLKKPSKDEAGKTAALQADKKDPDGSSVKS